MQDRPTAIELLQAAQEFCERDLQPALTGRVRFHARVLQNVLGIIERELQGEEVALHREWLRLQTLLEKDDVIPNTQRAVADQVKAWNIELATRIRTGTMDDTTDEVLEALIATVGEKLAIANPRWTGETS